MDINKQAQNLIAKGADAAQVEYVKGLYVKGKAAQESIEFYTQEQVNKIVKAIGKAVFDVREELSKEAVEESGLGVYEGKVTKHASVTTGQWLYLRDKQSVGAVNRDEAKALVDFAKPMGVLASVTPTTNPTTTVIMNSMAALKCRNAVIVAPHPKAKKVSAHCVNVIREALTSVGAPADLIQVIENPSIELTDIAMKLCDVVIATGGPGMVKAAYSSGKPSYGVGQGNTQVVLDRDYDDYKTMATNIIISRTYDNGVPCTGEQTIHVPAEKADDVIKAFVDQGCYYIDNAEDIDKIRKFAFVAPGGRTNVDIVGQPAPKAAKMAGIEGCPDDAKLLIMKVDKCGKAGGDDLSREIMCPILRVLPYDKYEEGVDNAVNNYLFEGAGHSSAIYSNNVEHVKYAANLIPVCRIVVNQGNIFASGRQQNGLIPTTSLGCGSWGNNSISENLNYKQLMNTTKLAYPIQGAHSPSHDEIWAMGPSREEIKAWGEAQKAKK